MLRAHVCDDGLCTQAKCPRRPEEDIGSPGAKVTEGCGPPVGCRESNLGPVDDEPELLTTESLPQP